MCWSPTPAQRLSDDRLALGGLGTPFQARDRHRSTARSPRLRKRQLIASFKVPTGNAGQRRGAYWGIGSDIAHYQACPSSLPAPHRAERAELGRNPDAAQAAVSAEHQERLINWGYAICDTAIRRHFLHDGSADAAVSSPLSDRRLGGLHPLARPVRIRAGVMLQQLAGAKDHLDPVVEGMRQLGDELLERPFLEAAILVEDCRRETWPR